MVNLRFFGAINSMICRGAVVCSIWINYTALYVAIFIYNSAWPNKEPFLNFDLLLHPGKPSMRIYGDFNSR